MWKTAIAVFHQFVSDGDPPREWAERLYNVRRWTPMPSGGHFAPAENPSSLHATLQLFSLSCVPTTRES